MKSAGFSLVEVLVATAVVSVGVASLAQLFTVSARARRSAHATTITLLLAQQKMEELRADGAGSAPSPPGALSANTQDYFDHVDRNGLSLGGSPSMPPPTGAVYVRRWAIEPLAGSAGSAVVLKVLVLELTGSGQTSEGSGITRTPGEARLVSVKTREVG